MGENGRALPPGEGISRDGGPLRRLPVEGAATLGISPLATLPPAGRKAQAVAEEPHRLFRARQARGKRAEAVTTRRQENLDPPRHVRSDRAASDTRGSRSLPEGHFSGRLFQGGRAFAGLSQVRRALGE